ncbi:uncharacterized protein LOC114856058 [Betta splendens]|uniref:Uncharacterized protein LOC114856058 n=1 Tax=Betta splendens TaxID=158456 RepID=A0A6P7MLI1_BETSP|nr:uncharacterized protein LOC114856058 [Betta splendens]
MKTLCVAVVVLSLTSVCQSATLACEKLLKPLDQSPDLSGRWFIIAMSSDYCLITAYLNSLIGPTFLVDVTAQDTPKVYSANFTMNAYGSCVSEVDPFFLEGSNLFKVDSNNAPTGEPDKLLLHTSCPDCIVGQTKTRISLFVLFSRRKTVTDAELKEFATQSDCLGFSKPEVLSTDHVYENCKSVKDKSDDNLPEQSAKVVEKLGGLFTAPLQCFAQSVFYYPRATLGWFQDKWDRLW